MPLNYINKLAKGDPKKKAALEKKWDEAKAAAKAEGHDEDFAYITAIFKKMAHVKESASNIDSVLSQLTELRDKKGKVSCPSCGHDDCKCDKKTGVCKCPECGETWND